LQIPCQNTGPSNLTSSTYIENSQKIKKANPINGFALFENDITGSEPTVKMLDT
jgi:hypothetical protein